MVERLLVGETLGLDLVNTQWSERGRSIDFLEEPGSVDLWLREYGFDTGEDELPSLLSARAAIRGYLAGVTPRAEAEVNAILARGAERPVMHDGSLRTDALTERGWRAAWSAVRSFAEIISTRPDRVRQCAHPDCTLYFFDTSKNGTRRWHSMETCGARAKASRHYRRSTEK